MLYEIPSLRGEEHPEWEKGIGGIPARLPNGERTEIPVLPGTNVLTIGVTGTGKTTSYTLPAAKRLLAADPEMKAAFFEIKHDFRDAFMEPGDKVVAYDPAAVPPENLFKWSIIQEIRKARNPEAEMMQIADALFSDLLADAEQNRAWIEAARNTFIAVLRVIIDCFPNERVSNRTLVNSLRDMSIKDILAYISKHPENRSLLTKDFSYDPENREKYTPTRRATDVFFFMNSVLEKFGGAFMSGGEDTIQDFLQGAYGRHLFLMHDLAVADAARPFLVYFLKKIKDEKMSNTSTVKSRVLLCLDEADKLADGGASADFGVFQAATLSRSCGLQLLVSTQSVESLYGLAPKFNEHIARSGLAGFPVLVAFRPGDVSSIETLQSLFGSKRKKIIAMPLSRYDHPKVTSEREPIVSEEEFASLKTGEAYVKIKSFPPQKVTILQEEFRRGEG